jgi:hypothetical protein
MFPAQVREAVTKPPEGLTEFEKAQGRPLVFRMEDESNPFLSSLAAKAALFDAQVGPSTQKPATRASYWCAWRSFATFLLIHGAGDQCLPASEMAIKAFGVQLLMVGYTGASLTGFVEAILDRHKQWKVDLTVPKATIHAWLAAMQKGLGLPKRDKFFILPVHIRCVLQLPRTSLRQLRDACIMVVGTICALRVSEIARIDVCDLLWDFDGTDTLAILLWYRKNDGLKRGLFPRIGKGSSLATCPLALLREYVAAAKLEVSKGCTKGKWKRSPCNACGRLFRNTTAAGKAMAVMQQDQTVNRSIIAAAVKDNLLRIGVAPDNFSAVSMRRGGVSAAVAAGVNETLWKLQSGHRSIAWQHYADVVRREQLYEFCNAFGL